MRVLNLIYLGAIALCLTLASCKGDQGEVGPAGANGINGTNGTNGIDGINGTNGTNGTDGLDGSDATAKEFAITIKPNDWTWNSTYKNWTVKQFTTNWNSADAVYGYIITGQGQVALPYYNFTNSTFTSFSKNLYQATPYILFTYENGSTSLSRPTSDFNVYLVRIPGSYARVDNSKLDYTNYEAVKMFYNLK